MFPARLWTHGLVNVTLARGPGCGPVLGVKMSKMLNGVLAGALALSVSATAPARADTTTIVGGVLLLSAAVGIARFGQRDDGGTSENTQYALTGQGTPQLSSRQAALWTEFRAEEDARTKARFGN